MLEMQSQSLQLIPVSEKWLMKSLIYGAVKQCIPNFSMFYALLLFQTSLTDNHYFSLTNRYLTTQNNILIKTLGILILDKLAYKTLKFYLSIALLITMIDDWTFSPTALQLDTFSIITEMTVKQLVCSLKPSCPGLKSMSFFSLVNKQC